VLVLDDPVDAAPPDPTLAFASMKRPPPLDDPVVDDPVVDEPVAEVDPLPEVPVALPIWSAGRRHPVTVSVLWSDERLPDVELPDCAVAAPPQAIVAAAIIPIHILRVMSPPASVC